MKKKLNRFLSLVAAVVVCAFFTSATAFAYDDREDYYIKDYDVNITVNTDNTYDIVETLVYEFNRPHHGPTRTFVENHTRQREDGSSDKIKAYVSKLNVYSTDAVDDIAETSTTTRGDTKYKTIKIGSSSQEYTGEHTYQIKYKYNIVTPDPLEDKDELYFNIIGTQWDCYIDHVTWTINLAEDFDASTVGYSVGAAGDAGFREEFLTSNVENHVINGEYNNPLNPYEGITIRAELPEGYFVYKDYSKVAYALFAVLAVISGFVMMYKPGKRPVEVVEFYPPDNISPVECEMIYTGTAPSKAMALLPHLANKGYFKVIEKEKGKFEFELTNANFDGLSREEYTFLDGMFPDRTEGVIVTEKELKKNKFYEVTEAVTSYVGLKATKLYDKKSVLRTVLALLWAVAVFILVIWLDVKFISNGTVDDMIMYVALAVVLPLIGIVVNKWNNVGTWLLTIAVFAMMIGINKFLTSISFVSVIVACVLAFLCGFFGARKLQRSEENMPIYGRVLGFRNFIKEAELDRLTMLCKENPNYFFDILGYAYALGLSGVWIKRFEQLQIPVAEPVWYVGAYPYSMHSFNRSFNNMMTRETANLATAPASVNSGGGGFSGGGFSGGGSGGGGGGAW
ncbi:MAG: DUF2207 domain-containing protein [Pseudobutyrivibrio sp.]|nr:DUF2207 domain-containing protein [Pseudobutyrivibrio sp.]